MKFLKKYSETTYILFLNVRTNSKKLKIVNDGDFLTVFLKSKPIQNKANKELISIIKTKLNLSSSQIQIISGSRSHKKLIKLTFLANIEEQEIIRRLFA
ncbi:MAG: DUF167 domain-containing protein [Promethearchaeota archaeon]